MDTGRGAEGTLSEPLAVSRILTVLQRRWWIIALCVVIVPIVAFVFSKSQTPVYSASSEVLLTQQNLAATITGTVDSSINRDAERITGTQAELARAPEVADQTVAVTGGGISGEDLLANSSVTASSASDLLTFDVRNGDAELAGGLATEYARQYIAYRLRLDTAAIESARKDLSGRIRQARESGDPALLASLTDTAQTLQTLQALQTANAILVRPGSIGEQTSPKPLRSLLLGLGVGLILGIGLAFLRESLDTRVRSAEEISERLELPLLGRLPEPPRKLRATHRLVMAEEPGSVHAEAFRMLRTNLEFVNPDRRARTIAVTSAVNEEGKSTTAANLAMALALGGSRVILVDLDLRLPSVHRFFGLSDRPGVTDVALDEATFGDALVSIPLDTDERSGFRANGSGDPQGLKVLPSGALPRDAGEFASSHALGSLLAELRQQCDVVIIDTPPLLRVGDTMAMSAYIDALVFVARMNVVSRPMLTEVSRLLRRVRAVKLGVVVTGSGSGNSYGNAYYGNETESRPAAKLKVDVPQAPR